LIALRIGESANHCTAWFAVVGVTPQVQWITQDITLTRALVGRGLGYAVLLQRQRHNLTLG
jgi:hypothetical protein